MPTICDWVPGVYQCSQLAEGLVCMRGVCADGYQIKSVFVRRCSNMSLQNGFSAPQH